MYFDAADDGTEYSSPCAAICRSGRIHGYERWYLVKRRLKNLYADGSIQKTRLGMN
jgi:hypothetical protein